MEGLDLDQRARLLSELDETLGSQLSLLEFFNALARFAEAETRLLSESSQKEWFEQLRALRARILELKAFKVNQQKELAERIVDEKITTEITHSLRKSGLKKISQTRNSIAKNSSQIAKLYGKKQSSQDQAALELKNRQNKKKSGARRFIKTLKTPSALLGARGKAKHQQDQAHRHQRQDPVGGMAKERLNTETEENFSARRSPKEDQESQFLEELEFHTSFREVQNMIESFVKSTSIIEVFGRQKVADRLKQAYTDLHKAVMFFHQDSPLIKPPAEAADRLHQKFVKSKGIRADFKIPLLAPSNEEIYYGRHYSKLYSSYQSENWLKQIERKCLEAGLSWPRRSKTQVSKNQEEEGKAGDKGLKSKIIKGKRQTRSEGFGAGNRRTGNQDFTSERRMKKVKLSESHHKRLIAQLSHTGLEVILGAFKPGRIIEDFKKFQQAETPFAEILKSHSLRELYKQVIMQSYKINLDYNLYLEHLILYKSLVRIHAKLLEFLACQVFSSFKLQFQEIGSMNIRDKFLFSWLLHQGRANRAFMLELVEKFVQQPVSIQLLHFLTYSS